MELTNLEGLARCLAHSRQSRVNNHGTPNDLTWKKIERLIRLCPNCQFKSVNKVPAIRQLRAVLDKQKERKPPFDRLYPPQDQLLDIKPETIYHFDELEQQSVLSLCKYLCVSHGQYLHKILPLLLRYLATLHLAKWPPHYFKNLFLMKIQHQDNQQNPAETQNNPTTNNNNNIIEEDKEDNKDNANEADNASLNAIAEEPAKLSKSHTTRDSMILEEGDDTNNIQIRPQSIHPATSLTAEQSEAITYITSVQNSDDENKDATLPNETEIKYDEDIPDDVSPKEQKESVKNKNKTDNDLMKYMDNPLRSPVCQFVMEFIYNIGDISHAVEESAPIIRQGIIIILKEYIKILKEGGDNDDINRSNILEYDDMEYVDNNTHHSLYIVLPIIWAILNAIKEDVYVSINIDRKSALAINKCVDTLSKYNNKKLWKSEWDILSTGVRASLLAYFLPPQGPIEKPPKKLFETKTIKDYFKFSMDIIGVKKSPSSIEVREQHMRLATICAIYERSLRQKLEKTIKEILNFHISKYIKSSFNVYKIKPANMNKLSTNIKHKNANNNRYSSLKYRMRDQTILINACCLVLEQLAERAPRQLQEISYYFQRLLIDRNAIYLQDEEINERLMDALARVCQCELKYMEDTYKNTQMRKKNMLKHIVDEFEEEVAIEEEKQLLFDVADGKTEAKLEEKEEKRDKHHKRLSSGLFAFSEQHNKHWYDDSCTRIVFNELENNFDDSVNEDSKLINRALRIYGAMMVKVNHKLITQQFLTSSLKGILTQKLTVILPYLIDTAINQQQTQIQFVKEIVQLLVQSYLTKSSYQLDTKRKIAEAFTELSSNLTQYKLRQFVLCELLKMFTTLSKTILNNHIKKKKTLVLASNELGLILPAIAVLCTPLYPTHTQIDAAATAVEEDAVDEDVQVIDEEHVHMHDDDKKPKKKNIFKRKKSRRHKESDAEVYEAKKINTQQEVEDGEGPEDNPTYFGNNEYVAEEWGVTLQGNHSQTVATFREFWNQIIFFDFVASTNNECKIYLQSIASVSPVLVSGSSTLFGGGLIHEVLKNKTNSMHINKQIVSLRSKLQHILPREVDVQHLEPDVLLFLNVLFHVESFRVYGSGTAYSLAHYLNDAGIIRMGKTLQSCVEAVVDYVFDRYLQHIYQSKASSEKLISLESHTEYLLAMCCNRSKRVRSKCYNWLQHKLIANYSYLQWRPKCLQHILDIVSKLETLIDDVSTELYSVYDSHSVITFNEKFSLDLPEDRKSRAEIQTIILEIAGSWLHSAWNLAPSEMISVVAHKLSLYKSPLLSSLMYTQCKYTDIASSSGGSKPNMGLMYVVSKCERYLGVMEGLYRTHLLHHNTKSFGQSKAQLFIQTFKKYIALRSKSNNNNVLIEQGMIEEMYHLGALIVWSDNKKMRSKHKNKLHNFKLPLEELLHLLCMVPAIVFTNNLVLTGTFVWRWIMTTSPELQEALIRQMRPAWSFVIEQRKGIFANKQVAHKEIEAHDIWISWLLNSIENIIESSPESVENISVILIDGLAAIPHYTKDEKPTHNVNNTSPAKNSSKSRPKVPQKPVSTAKQIRFGKRKRNKNKFVNKNAKKADKNTIKKDKNKDNKPTFDTYIATFGSTLRFYTTVSRVLSALRLASVPLLSKTIATMLRGRLYEGILQLFECKIVWRYPSSWKHVSSNTKAIVELFQFFMTEHRHVIKRYKTTKSAPVLLENNITNGMTNIPLPPSINIDNHRSKSTKLLAIRNANTYNTLTASPGTNNDRDSRVRPSLNTTMPYLNATEIPQANITALHHSYRHKKTQSFHYHHRSKMRGRTFTSPPNKTQRSPSIRRNSFGHPKNTSFDLDALLSEEQKNSIFQSPLNHTQPRTTPHHHSIRSLNGSIFDTLLLQTEHTMHNMSTDNMHNTDNIKHNYNANAYLFKLDLDDVYYWEGNNAFIQDKMTSWLHTNRGWCQMVCCVLLADELERLCAWYNTRDADNVSTSHQNMDNGNGNMDMDHDLIDQPDNNQNNSHKHKIDDRISKFLYQELLIEYIHKIGDYAWGKLCNVSWSFTPLLAIRFYQRFKYKDFQIQIAINNNNNGQIVKTITATLTQHIHQQPKSIQNIPDGTHLLITDQTVKKDGIELEELCQFRSAPLYKCLALLKEKNLTHSIVNQYLFRSLRYESQINMCGVIFLIPQLLQALRFDPSGVLREFLIDCAVNDLTMAHQLIWLCDCESFRGEDMHSPENNNVYQGEDDDFCAEMARLSAAIRDTFRIDADVMRFYENEFSFFDVINSASVDIEAGSKYDKNDKKRLIRAALIEIRDRIDTYKVNGNKLYMPTNPTWQVIDILPDTVIALQSAAKVPFLVDFKVKKYTKDIGHMLQNKNQQNKGILIESEPPIEIQKCIFKTHDDCGQDALTLQVIEYFKDIFLLSGLPLLLFPYRVIATRSGKDKVVGGMIECVRNARSRSDLGNENNYRLRRYFIETYGDVESASFKKAQRNFILSLAGYAVVCYLLQIKDRHNANIMINNEGHLIHIDFGFLFDISPGKNIGFETAGFKINDEMVELIGDDGSHTTPLFLWFVELCIRGYLVCRQHMDEILSIIELSSNSSLPCFLPQTMTNLRNRFVPQKSTTEAALHMKQRVIHACSTWTTNAYDEFQKRSQGIWKAPAKDED